jgi:hypothetical protein
MLCFLLFTLQSRKQQVVLCVLGMQSRPLGLCIQTSASLRQQSALPPQLLGFQHCYKPRQCVVCIYYLGRCVCIYSCTTDMCVLAVSLYSCGARGPLRCAYT